MPLRHATAEFVMRGLDLSGKTYLVTGITSGIGKETARVLAARGATVFGTGRTHALIKEACLEIGERARPFECELRETRSVREFIRQVRESGQVLDGIVANAGIMTPPECKLINGVEQQFFINHIAHYMIVEDLLDRLSPTGRVVIVSSDLHKQAPRGGIDYDKLDCHEGYEPLKSYALSKFANVTYARVLAKRFQGTGKKSFSLHPGIIYTNLLRYQNVFVRTIAGAVGKYLFKSVEQGASTQCYAVAHPEASAPNTGYLENCREALAHPDVNSRLIQERLMEESHLIASRT